MRRITTLLLTQLPLLLFSDMVSGDGAPKDDGKTWVGIVCSTPEELFTAAYDIHEGRGLNGDCEKRTLPRGLVTAVLMTKPFRATMYTLGRDVMALEMPYNVRDW